MPRATHNGTRLYYEDRGEGDPVVFLHGVTMGSRFFDDQLPYFADRFRTIALDFRGHGRSEAAETGHTVPQYARDLRAFLEGRELEGVVPVAWSMGALVLWEYVEQFGTDGLAGAVIVDQHASDFAWEGYDHGFADFDAFRELVELSQSDPDALVDQLMTSMFREPPAEPTASRLADEISRVRPPIRTAILFDQTLRDYRETLPAVDVPALVCAGEDDGLISTAGVEYVADRMPRTEFERFEESGHCPFLEEPDRFNERVAGWIESL